MSEAPVLLKLPFEYRRIKQQLILEAKTFRSCYIYAREYRRGKRLSCIHFDGKQWRILLLEEGEPIHYWKIPEEA